MVLLNTCPNELDDVQILGTFLAITAILFSSCGASSSSETPEPGGVVTPEPGGVVTIGTQVWTSGNLDVATYRNGDVIPEVQDENAWAKLTTGAWCYYDNDTSNGTKYGKLYNWYAVSDPRGLAPNGYHIPTDAEWTQLSDYLGGQSEAGRKMKSTSGWKNNGNGTNSSGFSGLPFGSRDHIGAFFGIDNYGFWWSSTEDITGIAWSRYLHYSVDRVARHPGYEGHGFSVRCLRD